MPDTDSVADTAFVVTAHVQPGVLDGRKFTPHGDALHISVRHRDSLKIATEQCVSRVARQAGAFAATIGACRVDPDEEHGPAGMRPYILVRHDK